MYSNNVIVEINENKYVRNAFQFLQLVDFVTDLIKGTVLVIFSYQCNLFSEKLLYSCAKDSTPSIL
jgi:hypothetical protein